MKVIQTENELECYIFYFSLMNGSPEKELLKSYINLETSISYESNKPDFPNPNVNQEIIEMP